MKLLIITQVIDTEHPILGFFHRWTIEFAKHYEHVHVICLQAGKHSLPANVTVHSLGKEEGKGRLTYLWRFYTLIWQLRHEYDHVFVHMNQIYVILGAPFWRAAHKKIGLWYAHGAVSASLRVAVPLTHHVFTSTAQGLQLKTKKRHIVGQGIDTTLFTPTGRQPNEVLELITVGRISASKNIDTLLHACAHLKSAGKQFHFSIIGAPPTPTEEAYATKMKALATQLGIAEQITWHGAVANHQLPNVLKRADVFIHDGTTNSLDKALLEAVLCGCIVLSSNPSYRGLTEAIAPQYLFDVHDAIALGNLLVQLDVKTDTTHIRNKILSIASLEQLVSGIVARY